MIVNSRRRSSSRYVDRTMKSENDKTWRTSPPSIHLTTLGGGTRQVSSFSNFIVL